MLQTGIFAAPGERETPLAPSAAKKVQPPNFIDIGAIVTIVTKYWFQVV